jgi:hypothetical protein
MKPEVKIYKLGLCGRRRKQCSQKKYGFVRRPPLLFRQGW